MRDAEIQLAQDALEQVQGFIRMQAVLFLRLGKALKDIRDQKLYLHLGDGGNDTFVQFLNNPDVGLSQSTAYLYIRIYEYYELKLGLEEKELIKTPLNRLMRLLPKLKQMKDEDAVELIESTNYLTNYDFKQELKDRKLIQDKPTMFQCQGCSKWVVKFKDEQLCKCAEPIAPGDILG